MSSEVADLYVSLRANTAPLTAAFGEGAVAGEEFSTKVVLATNSANTAIRDMAATVTSEGLVMEERWTAVAVTMNEDAAQIVRAFGSTAAAAQASADTAAAAAAKEAESFALMRDKIAADLAGVKAAEAEGAVANEALGAAWMGTGEKAAGASRGMSTFKASLNDSAGVIGLTGGQLMGLGAAAVGVAAVTVKMAGDFQANTEKLVTSANEVQGNIGMVRDGITSMAGQVGYSSEALATAMYKIESGGQHGADGLMVLRAAAEGAKTENADLTTVGDAVTTMLTDYHLKATDAALVTSRMVQATASGKMTFEELAGSLSNVAPLASAAGISMNDMLGVLASMTSHGISAQNATQNMGDAIRHLQAPTSIMRNEMNLLGVNADDVAMKLGQRGLSGTMEMLQQAVGKAMPPGTDQVWLQMKTAVQNSTPAVQDLASKVMDGSMSMAGFTKAAKGLDVISAKQATSFATLAGTTHQLGGENKSGAQVLQSYGAAMSKAMGDSTGLKVALMTTGDNAGNTDKAVQALNGTTVEAGGHVKGWGEIQQNFNQKMSQAKDGLGALAITIGEKLLPIVTPIVGAIADFTTWLTQNQAAATVLAVVIGGIVVIAFAAAAVAAWSFTAALLANPVVWIVVGIIAAIAGLVAIVVVIVDNWSSIAGFFAGLWQTISDIFSTAVGFIGGVIGNVVDFFTSAFDDIGKIVGNVVQWFSDLPGNIGSALASLGSTVLTAIGDVASWLVKPFVDGWNAVVAFFSQSPRQIGEELGHLVGTFTRAAVDGVNAFFTWVGNTWNDGVQWFKDLPGKIGTAVGQANDWLKNKAHDMIVSFYTWVGKTWDDGVTWFKSLPDKIGTAVGQANDWLKAKAHDMIVSFYTWVGKTWDDGIAWFKSLPGKIGTAVGKANDWLKDKAHDLFVGFYTWVGKTWDDGVQWFKDLPGKIGKFFADAGKWLVDAGKNIIQGLWNGAVDIWNGFTGWISDMTGGAVDGFNKGFGNKSPSTKLHETGVNVMKGLQNGVDSERGSFMDMVNKIGPDAVAFFSGAGQWLVNAGYNVVMGLWNGIQSVASWLYNAVSSWAGGIINAAKSALGIASPSKHTHEMGMQLAQGLAAGIDAHTQIATAAAARMAAAVLGAANPGGLTVGGLHVAGGDGAGLASLAATSSVLTGVGSSGAGGGATTVHAPVYVTVQGTVVTQQDLVNGVQTALLQRGIRNNGAGITYSGFGSGS